MNNEVDQVLNTVHSGNMSASVGVNAWAHGATVSNNAMLLRRPKVPVYYHVHLSA